ncbi:MAG: hypothetical protein CME06_15520 [Gemmatimonadetes bacterium]|nr:hypothetical protein [Gemmatimonadota bacterium]
MLYYLYSATATIDHSDVDDACELVWGEGMLDLDPGFAEPEIGDYHLALTSPCRGVGDSHAAGMPYEDFEHDPRGADGAVDIGADEFHPHLYFVGDVSPWDMVDIRVVSGRIGAPVALGLGEGARFPRG